MESIPTIDYENPSGLGEIGSELLEMEDEIFPTQFNRPIEALNRIELNVKERGSIAKMVYYCIALCPLC